MESLNALVTRTLFDKHISLAKQLCDELHLSAIVIWHLHDDFWDEKRISKGGIRYSIDGDGRCCRICNISDRSRHAQLLVILL